MNFTDYKPHPDNEEILVSSEGKVYCRKQEIFVTISDKQGYSSFWFFDKNRNKKRSELLHRAVYKSHVENIDSSIPLNHIDGIKKNNSIANLEKSSISENNRHSRFILGNNSGIYLRKYSESQVLTIATLLSVYSPRKVSKLVVIEPGTLASMKRGQNYKMYRELFTAFKTVRDSESLIPNIKHCKNNKYGRGVSFVRGIYYSTIRINKISFREGFQSPSEASEHYKNIFYEWYGVYPE